MVVFACGCLVCVPPGDKIIPVVIRAFFRHFWARHIVGFGQLTGAGGMSIPVNREKFDGFNIPRGVGTSFNGAIEHHHGWRTRSVVGFLLGAHET